MRKSEQFAAVLVLIAALFGQFASAQKKPVYQFNNGNWFDGEKFSEQVFYSVNGFFTKKKPSSIDETIDLKGKFIVPPFGEAHNHNLEDEAIRRYLEAGIFYVKCPNNLPALRAGAKSKINIPGSLDAVFSNGGLTASEGHPLGLVKRNIEREIWTEKDAEGAFYFTIDSFSDLDNKWNKIISEKPDFIKTYLLFSEEFASRKNDRVYFAQKGLDPLILKAIVERARRHGLRVSTHVETAADFRHAVEAGVDEINHLPGFRADGKLPVEIYKISEKDARLAARKKIVVVTTAGALIEQLKVLAAQNPQDESVKSHLEMIRYNLKVLMASGVPLAIGSDEYRHHALQEIFSLRSLNLFDNLKLLKLWSENTPRTIFPRRKIGRLKSGYEASFLALDGNPLSDFENVKKIALRFKQGEKLTLPAAAKN